MSLAAAEVNSRDNAVPSSIPVTSKCDVSFDATWHRRGHYSNQSFGAAIDVVSNKVLDYKLSQRVCRKCLSWAQEIRDSLPDENEEFWLKIFFCRFSK